MENFEEFKKFLEAEKEKLEKTLGTLGWRDPKVVGDGWEPKYPDLNSMKADKSEVADEAEEFENRVGVESGLEARLKDVISALSRIEKEMYGKCSRGGEDLDVERLRANPAADICVKHSKE